MHEVYVRLVDVEKVQHWNSRGHFFAAAAEAMRRILVDTARRKARLKRGGGMSREHLANTAIECGVALDDLLDLDDAIARLEQKDPLGAQAVKLRFFGGLSHQDIGKALGVSAITARQHWRYARVWLHRELKAG